MDNGQQNATPSDGAPVFKSTDIRNTKAHNQGEYFVQQTKPPFSKRAKEWFAKNKRLVIIIVVVVLLAIAAIVAGSILLNQPEPSRPITYVDIDQIFADETTSTSEKITFADEKIVTLEAEGKADEAFNLKSNLVRHLINDSKDYNSAINYVHAIDAEGLSTAQLWECFNLLADAYEGLGDTEQAKEHRYIAEQYQHKLDAELNSEDAFLEQE